LIGHKQLLSRQSTFGDSNAQIIAQLQGLLNKSSSRTLVEGLIFLHAMVRFRGDNRTKLLGGSFVGKEDKVMVDL